MFAGTYPSSDGRPSVPSGEPACIVVLQVPRSMSDVEAVQHLRYDLRWQAACGLGQNDPGSGPSLSVYFRCQPACSTQPDRIAEKVREVVAATGVLQGTASASPHTATLPLPKACIPPRPGSPPQPAVHDQRPRPSRSVSPVIATDGVMYVVTGVGPHREQWRDYVPDLP
ncbi:transposase [Streptomyces rimosus]|uniref:transposase n=1 Tax=Streptomyces rimosus TaxID=1927 RepID=UPI00131E6728